MICEDRVLYKKTGRYGCKKKQTFSPLSKEFFYDECDLCEHLPTWETEESILNDSTELEQLSEEY